MNMNEWHIDLGERLRRARLDSGMLLKDAANILGVHKNILSSYERAEPTYGCNEARPVPSVLLHRAAALYNVSAQYLLGTAK